MICPGLKVVFQPVVQLCARRYGPLPSSFRVCRTAYPWLPDMTIVSNWFPKLIVTPGV